jgi:hypothetical protein
VKPEKIDRYLSRVRTRATEIRDGVAERGIAGESGADAEQDCT